MLNLREEGSSVGSSAVTDHATKERNQVQLRSEDMT